MAQAGKESTSNVADLGSILGLGRHPGEGNSYPLQFSGLENSMDYVVHGVPNVSKNGIMLILCVAIENLFNT